MSRGAIGLSPGRGSDIPPTCPKALLYDAKPRRRRETLAKRVGCADKRVDHVAEFRTGEVCGIQPETNQGVVYLKSQIARQIVTGTEVGRASAPAH